MQSFCRTFYNKRLKYSKSCNSRGPTASPTDHTRLHSEADVFNRLHVTIYNQMSHTGRLISSPRRHIASSKDVKNGHYSYRISQISDAFHVIVIDIDYLNIPTFYYFSRNIR
ncbi:hypothetical protein DPMN_138041 [Dreissena polymorpha]|uniref:Uncharacterized protein n=1 Tax=Dreissena polymorpha TaxID=45954 RepID=A0A9D4G312_DREPO|nr:hypothetical protein DPMN_138041 [Dreissena polymorpha]